MSDPRPTRSGRDDDIIRIGGKPVNRGGMPLADDVEEADVDEAVGVRDDGDAEDGYDHLPPPPPGGSDGEVEAAEEVFVDGTVGRSNLAAERDEYKEAFMRVKADFENYRKRVDKSLADRVERATGQLVSDLLPVLDACDAAIGHGAADVEPIHKTLLDMLEREGLERVDPVGDPFDPTAHEAVAHEEGEPGDPPTVVESLRIGYAWKGKVLRPAMVKVKG